MGRNPMEAPRGNSIEAPIVLFRYSVEGWYGAYFPVSKLFADFRLARKPAAISGLKKSGFYEDVIVGGVPGEALLFAHNGKIFLAVHDDLMELGPGLSASHSVLREVDGELHCSFAITGPDSNYLRHYVVPLPASLFAPDGPKDRDLLWYAAELINGWESEAPAFLKWKG